MSEKESKRDTGNSCDQIHKLYTDLANNPDKDFGWSKGKENARQLGYDENWLNKLSEQVWESCAAVGNPFCLGSIGVGETVVDIGCGAGADLCVAALLVGVEGQVIGIDLTEAMVEKSRDNTELSGFKNVEVYQSDISKLPIPDACADIVISNGSINLSPSKLCVFKEVLRVLRPGGRLQIADMVKNKNCKETYSDKKESWADCVSGTLTPECLMSMIKESGFEKVEFVSFTNYRTAITTIGATFRAVKPRNEGGEL